MQAMTYDGRIDIEINLENEDGSNSPLYRVQRVYWGQTW